MGLVDVLIRPQRTLPGAALSATLARFAEQCRRSGGVPLRLRLPDNTVLEFGPSVDLTLRLRDPSAAAGTGSPDAWQVGRCLRRGAIRHRGRSARSTADRSATGRGGRRVGAATHCPGVAPASAPPGSGGDRPALRRWQRLLSPVAGPSDGVLVRLLPGPVRKRSTKRSVRSWITSAASCGSSLANGCSMSAAAGAGWSCTPRRNTECAPSASRCRATRLNLHANGYVQAGLQHAVDIQLLDYRDLEARFGQDAFDKVASVGMFEHVGLAICRDTSLQSPQCCATADCS